MSTTVNEAGTGAKPEAVERAELIASLRALIDIFEQVPEIPIPNVLGWAVGGRDDTAVPVMETVAKAVEAAGIPHVYSVREHSRRLDLHVGAIQFDLSHLHDRAHADYQARRSYEPVVRVGDEQGGEVAA